MDLHPTAILQMVDQLVMTNDDDAVKTTVEVMRRVLEGTTLSSVILQRLVPFETERQIDSLKAEKQALEIEIDRLKTQLDESQHRGSACDGFYTMEQFLSILTAKLRRSYGWRTDYITASHETVDCTPVPNEEIHKWQINDKVPEWAVEQIDRLTFPKRTGVGGTSWSPEDEAYLTELYQADPRQRNATLAAHCAQQFGRDINESSIKGALDRLRKRGRLPRKRPSRVMM